MHIKTSLPTLALATALFIGGPLFAQHDHAERAAKPQAAPAAGKLLKVTEKDEAWAAKVRQAYPLDVCVASDEKLGAMGKSPEYIYRVKGQPDRLVIFCCDGCEEDFLKEPAKYLAKLDAAAKNKGPAGKSGGVKREHNHE
ncbi:MAG: hypothetical protein Q7S40_24685 [Opitutaceae bacterium]|nr:hypothetical protein [Opitutaceae bacterium]